jgi:hypothetical protein
MWYKWLIYCQNNEDGEIAMPKEKITSEDNTEVTPMDNYESTNLATSEIR